MRNCRRKTRKDEKTFNPSPSFSKSLRTTNFQQCPKVRVKAEPFFNFNHIIVDITTLEENSIYDHYLSVPICSTFPVDFSLAVFQLWLSAFWALICRHHDQKKSWCGMTGQWCVCLSRGHQRPHTGLMQAVA